MDAFFFLLPASSSSSSSFLEKHLQACLCLAACFQLDPHARYIFPSASQCTSGAPPSCVGILILCILIVVTVSICCYLTMTASLPLNQFFEDSKTSSLRVQHILYPKLAPPSLYSSNPVSICCYLTMTASLPLDQFFEDSKTSSLRVQHILQYIQNWPLRLYTPPTQSQFVVI